jgi:trehalose 6-phosphate synthase
VAESISEAKGPRDDADHRPIVLVSNRGPVSFRSENGELVAKRGAGGLVSGLAPLVMNTDTTWIAAAMSDADRAVSAQGLIEAEGFRMRMLDLDPNLYRMSYDVICNATLWFVHHHLYELARRPRFDQRWHQAWDAYRAINVEFAKVVVDDAPENAVVLVQDYHLALLAPFIRANRRDLRTVHFTHTPWAEPDLLRVLPDDVVGVLLEAMTAHDACGFHTARWARAFDRCCEEIIGDAPRTFVAPLATDPDDIRETAASDACTRELDELDAALHGRRLITRVDRIELSKNLLRGFHAFDELLERYPEWRGTVVFGAFVYPSREGLPEYLAYRSEVETLVARINERWRTDDWQPILLDTSDNYARSVAALRRYDVLLVNPIRDGLNLVATEGPLVNDHDGVVVLSPEAGAWAELGGEALRANPFDQSGTADALHRALSMDRAERALHAAAMRALAERRTPADWLHDQLAAATS